LATRSFTIPIHTTGTIPTAIILMVTDTDTDTVALAAVASVAAASVAVASVAVAFAPVGDPYNQSVPKAAPDTDEEKSIHQSVFQKLGNKIGGAPVVLNECDRAQQKEELCTPRAVAEASNDTMAKEQRYYRSDRYVLHIGVMWRHPRAVRSQWQRTFRDLRPVETGRRCGGGTMQTLWF